MGSGQSATGALEWGPRRPPVVPVPKMSAVPGCRADVRRAIRDACITHSPGPVSFVVGGVPLNDRNLSMGRAGLVGLVLLRLTVGWHFLYQGLTKFEDSNFSSLGFLSQAKGPLAETYGILIPDRQGLARLDAKQVIQGWEDDRIRAAKHFRYTAAQDAEADKLFASRVAQLEGYLDENAEAIATYQHELARWQAANADERFRQVGYQRKRIWDRRKALQGEAQVWLSEVDRLGAAWRDDLTQVAEPHQRQLGAIPEPRTPLGWADLVVKWSNVAIGGCLMIGLLTRWAALGGALFLLSIVLAQFPWPTIYPPDPPSAGKSLLVNKEVVEMMALVALAMLPMGRLAGIDRWLGLWWRRRRQQRA